MNSALQIGSGDFTVAAWGTHPGTSDWSILVSDRNAGYAEGWFLGFEPSGKLACTVEDAARNARYYYSDEEFDDNTWHHFACTWEAGPQTLTLYVDGAAATLSAAYENGSVGTIQPSTHLNIGRQPNNYSHWQGMIDEVNLYNRALWAEEIQALFASYSDTPAAPAMMTISAAPERFGGHADSLRVDNQNDATIASLRNLVTLDGQTLFINVADSPELNYGVENFTVAVRTGIEFEADGETPVNRIEWDSIPAALSEFSTLG